MKHARRLEGLGPSPIRQISDHAPPDAIPLGLGAPGWALPEVARAALVPSAGPLGYGPNVGRNELREAIAAYHEGRAEEIVVTVGSQDALFSLFLAWLDEGDEVLIPDPAFPAYATLGRIAGARVVTFPLRAEARWRLEPAAFLAALDAHPRVRVALVNHPSNPTGGGCDAASLRAVADACAARDVLLVSDEVYRDLWFGERPPGLLDVARTGVVVSSVSKGWGAPGLRVGWMAGERRWIAPAILMHNYAVTSAAGPSQAAALALLRNSDTVLPAARAEVHARWTALTEAMEEHLGFRPGPPDGSFYFWMRLPPGGARDPLGFCLRLRDEAKVVIVPSTAFSDTHRAHARVSFAATPEQIREGIRRIAPYFG